MEGQCDMGILIKDLNPMFKPDSISLIQLKSKNIQYIPWWEIS